MIQPTTLAPKHLLLRFLIYVIFSLTKKTNHRHHLPHQQTPTNKKEHPSKSFHPCTSMTTTCTRVLRRVTMFFNPSPRAPRGARLHPSNAFEAPHAVAMQNPHGHRDRSGCMTMPLHTVTAWCESTHSLHLFASVAAGVSHLNQLRCKCLIHTF